ncbi:Ig-like domain-containing protein [Plantactinospora veratri]
MQGSGAGTGVLRWRANGETVESVRSPVLIRTTVGQVPALPGELDGVYASGARGKVGFDWQEITPEMVAETNVEPFVVYGTNDAYGLIAEARVYVRPETAPGGISIQGAETFQQDVEVGELPYLPERVEVSYNDGSRDNQAIGVDWDFDESVVDTPGRYTVIGNLVLPDYVSEAGTTRTTLTLTVGDPPEEPAWDVRVQTRTQCIGGNAYLSVNAVNAEAVPLTIALVTPYGSRTVAEVAPGKAAYQAFNARTSAVPAGTATVRASGTVDGQPVTAQLRTPYGALDCG